MPALLRKDQRLGEGADVERWAVVRKIGDGGFAEVYEVRDILSEDQRYALKIDKLERRKDPRGGTVKAEHKVLAQLQECQQVCRLVPNGEGTWEGRSYLLMELLGLNLAMYQRAYPHNGRINPTEAKRIGLTILNALEGIHRLGWLHRDVKPANFALYQGPGASPAGDWRAIDFGIARRYTSDTGAVLPRREEYAEFRGSTTYASIHAHLKQDLGRVDDLWSWLYMIVEMLEGSLPWRARTGSPGAGAKGATGGGSGGSSEEAGKAGVEKEREGPKELAQRMKQQCLGDPNRLSASGELPRPLVAASLYLRGLGFEERPDYGFLRSLLAAIPEPPSAAAAQPPPQHQQQQQQQHPAAAPGLIRQANGTPQPATPTGVPHPPVQLQPPWPLPAANGHAQHPSNGHMQHPSVANGHRQQQGGAGGGAGAYQQALPPQPSAFAPRGRHQPSPFAPQGARHAGAGGQPVQAAAYAGGFRVTWPPQRAGSEGLSLAQVQGSMSSSTPPAGGHAHHIPGYAMQAWASLYPHQQQQWQAHAQQQAHANGAQHAPHSGWPAAAPPLPEEPQQPAGASSMDELGQIGSEFEPEEDDSARAAWGAGAARGGGAQEACIGRPDEAGLRKHARGREDAAGTGADQGGGSRAAKRARGCSGGQAAAVKAEQGAANMAQFAAVVAQGRLSQEALEVRQKLRSLAPAEGVGILAWLVETLSRTAQPSSSQHVRTLPAVLQVGHWLSSLAAFTEHCASQCQAAPPQ